MTTKIKCPFCHIKKNDQRIIFEGKYVLVIFSNPRLMPGHLLVIPKRHIERLTKLSKEEKVEIFETIIMFQEKILKNIAPGCDIRQHYRPFIKQNDLKINHLHIHLQPRFLDDELYKKSQIYHKEIFKQLTKKETEQIQRKLKD